MKNMPQADHETLIPGLQCGEESAYRTLFSLYYEPMCALANAILHDEYLAQATSSDVISHLYEKRDEINIHTNLRSYLMTSTRNACYNALGTKVKRIEQHISALSEAEVRTLFGDTDSATPQRVLMDNEFNKMVEDFIDNLPAPLRSSFVKSRYGGMTYREIAKVDGVSANTIKERIKNVLRIFDQRFHKYLSALVLAGILMQAIGGF